MIVTLSKDSWVAGFPKHGRHGCHGPFFVDGFAMLRAKPG
jgi:hypothetical protein